MLSSIYGFFDQAERYAHGGYRWTIFSGTFCSNFGIPDLATYAFAASAGSRASSTSLYCSTAAKFTLASTS